MGSRSKSSMDAKYALTPYTPLARSLRNRSLSSRHTGRLDSDISVR